MKDNLCIPIYLNDKIVFDLLAIIEDGFSKVSEITTSSVKEKNINGQVDSGVSSTGILSNFFGVTLSGKLSSDDTNKGSSEHKQEKVHTNVSLFSKLRKILIDNNVIIHNDCNLHKVNPGDFIEIEGNLRKNPLVNTLESTIDTFKTFISFVEEPKLGNKSNAKKVKSENEKMIEEMNIIYNDLIKTNTVDLLVDIKGGNKKALLSAQINYFIDGFESELVEGSYRILGKVIKVSKENEVISLFRKTSFKVFQKTFIDEFIDELNKSMNNGEAQISEIKLPKIISEVEGPCIVVIPIAIYV